jgi:hypothetical protein
MTSFHKKIDITLISIVYTLIFICVFDPADKILGLKVPIFFICWLFFIFRILCSNKIFSINKGLLGYVVLMISIPLLSIIIYLLVNGDQPFQGFILFKSYLFISFSIIIYTLRINLIPFLSRVLNFLALLIIFSYLLLIIAPDFMPAFILFGEKYGLLVVGDRDYSADLTLRFVFFVTSPMLVISIAYYAERFMTNPLNKFKNSLFLFINICGMFLAGTRNNMLASILLPITIIFYLSKNKMKLLFYILFGLIIFIILYFNELKILVSSDEESNQLKIGFMKDYFELFKNPLILLFGQGLGSFHYWTGRGSFYITELTYLEIVRNFGLPLGLVMYTLMIFPIFSVLFFKRTYPNKSIIISYLFYLFMCLTNPLFFSSLGILILSIILSNIFLYKINNNNFNNTNIYIQ